MEKWTCAFSLYFVSPYSAHSLCASRLLYFSVVCFPSASAQSPPACGCKRNTEIRAIFQHIFGIDYVHVDMHSHLNGALSLKGLCHQLVISSVVAALNEWPCVIPDTLLEIFHSEKGTTPLWHYMSYSSIWTGLVLMDTPFKWIRLSLYNLNSLFPIVGCFFQNQVHYGFPVV